MSVHVYKTKAASYNLKQHMIQTCTLKYMSHKLVHISNTRIYVYACTTNDPKSIDTFFLYYTILLKYVTAFKFMIYDFNYKKIGHF